MPPIIEEGKVGPLRETQEVMVLCARVKIAFLFSSLLTLILQGGKGVGVCFFLGFFIKITLLYFFIKKR